MSKRVVSGFDGLSIQDVNGERVISLKVRYARRGGFVEAGIKAQAKAAENLDDQPHMTLTPSKDGQPYHGMDHQRPSLLDAAEAHRHGFWAGARWARRRARREKRQEK